MILDIVEYRLRVIKDVNLSKYLIFILLIDISLDDSD